MTLREEMASDTRDRTRVIRGLVRELASSFDEHMRSLTSRFQLTLTQAAALRELSSDLTMRELADRLCCEPSNVTFVVDRLEERGLLDRRPHPKDRRAKQLVLTTAGHTMRGELLAALDRHAPLQHLSETQLHALERELLSALGGKSAVTNTANHR
jgi:MarR family transcriptional regulator, organic hydroperoxide resistance regulator